MLTYPKLINLTYPNLIYLTYHNLINLTYSNNSQVHTSEGRRAEGAIPRVFSFLFEKLASQACKIFLSITLIWNDGVSDLLSEANNFSKIEWAIIPFVFTIKCFILSQYCYLHNWLTDPGLRMSRMWSSTARKRLTEAGLRMSSVMSSTSCKRLDI